jgi:hypothetical protein
LILTALICRITTEDWQQGLRFQRLPMNASSTESVRHKEGKGVDYILCECVHTQAWSAWVNCLSLKGSTRSRVLHVLMKTPCWSLLLLARGWTPTVGGGDGLPAYTLLNYLCRSIRVCTLGPCRPQLTGHLKWKTEKCLQGPSD